MSDTNAKLAGIAEKVAAGHISAALAHAAMRQASESDVRAKRIFFDGLAAFRSNTQDAADLCPANRTMLEAFLKVVDACRPTEGSWDASIVVSGAQREVAQ